MDVTVCPNLAFCEGRRPAVGIERHGSGEVVGFQGRLCGFAARRDRGSAQRGLSSLQGLRGSRPVSASRSSIPHRARPPDERSG